jgi:hypothetical protein
MEYVGIAGKDFAATVVKRGSFAEDLQVPGALA